MGGYGVIVTDPRNGRQWFDRGGEGSDAWHFCLNYEDAWRRERKIAALNPDLNARVVHVAVTIEEV